jgi:hypothetical protein
MEIASNFRPLAPCVGRFGIPRVCRCLRANGRANRSPLHSGDIVMRTQGIQRLLCRVVVPTLLVCCAVNRAPASPIVFSGFDPGASSVDPRPNSDAAAAAFAAALSSSSVITFEQVAVGPFANLVVAPGVSLSGFDVFNNPETIRNAPAGTPDNLFGYNTTPGGSQFLAFRGGEAFFTFSQPIDSFGFYLTGQPATADGSAEVQFNDGSYQALLAPVFGDNGGAEFFGFTDAGASISSVNIYVGGVEPFNVGVDDIRYGTAVTLVPEPASAGLLSLGAVALALRRRRRKV